MQSVIATIKLKLARSSLNFAECQCSLRGHPAWGRGSDSNSCCTTNSSSTCVQHRQASRLSSSTMSPFSHANADKAQSPPLLRFPPHTQQQGLHVTSAMHLGERTHQAALNWHHQQPHHLRTFASQQQPPAHQLQQRRCVAHLRPFAEAPKLAPRFRRPDPTGQLNRMVIRIPPQVQCLVQDGRILLTGEQTSPTSSRELVC